MRIPAEFRFSIDQPNGTFPLSASCYRVFEKNSSEHHSASTKKSNLLRYATVPGDSLTIVCRVRVLLGTETASDTLSIPACKMQQDFETILKNQQFTDVTLIVEGRSIKAHKVILATRSPVFAAMFTEDNRQNQVTITDMKYGVAQKLLQFMYTGKTEIEPNTADLLMAAADKYDLVRLKAQCEQTILNTLTISTAIKVLIFADRINAEQLKSRAIKLIKSSMDKVVETADWKTMTVEHPKLLIEVCRP